MAFNIFQSRIFDVCREYHGVIEQLKNGKYIAGLKMCSGIGIDMVAIDWGINEFETESEARDEASYLSWKFLQTKTKHPLGGLYPNDMGIRYSVEDMLSHNFDGVCNCKRCVRDRKSMV